MPSEREVGSVGIIEALPEAGNLPRITGTLPAAGPVPLDDRILPQGSSRPSYWAFMNGRWINISPYVRSAEWQHGNMEPVRIGAILNPAVGALLLDNRDGEWSPFNPHALIDPYPGVSVEIRDSVDRSGELLFWLSLIHI